MWLVAIHQRRAHLIQFCFTTVPRMEADSRAQAESAVHQSELSTKDKLRELREESRLKQTELESELESMLGQLTEAKRQNVELNERHCTV